MLPNYPWPTMLRKFFFVAANLWLILSLIKSCMSVLQCTEKEQHCMRNIEKPAGASLYCTWKSKPQCSIMITMGREPVCTTRAKRIGMQRTE